MDNEDVFILVDYLINYPRRVGLDELVFSPRLGNYAKWSELAALEEKVLEWTGEHRVVWNVGIGPAASFVPTLTRLLIDGSKVLYGPFDQITHLRLPPAEATSSSTSQHQLAFEVLKEILMRDDSNQLQEVKRLAAEESYFAYGKMSDYLLLQACGQWYIDRFASDQSVRMDPIYDRQPYRYPILPERIAEALQGKKTHLLVVENLHVPVFLSVLADIMGRRWYPTLFKNRRWLISATSKDVWKNSRHTEVARGKDTHSIEEYYYAPPFDDLRSRDWSVLIKEALRDAARCIYMALQDKGYPVEFWLNVAQQCLYYGVLYHPLHGEGAAAHQASSVSSHELVRCWVAEDLIFSTAIITNTPLGTSQKQRNYYRSAYEAGKVVIQTLQEYCLLPIYSVSASAGSTSSSEETTSAPFSSQDAVTGVSKLAEDVPCLKEDELNAHLNMSNQLRWVSFMNDDGRHVSWDWNPRKAEHTMMTTLILRACSNISAFCLNKLFIPHLRVLDLSYTPINSLPPWFSNLLNLYLLSLRGCSQLDTLYPPPSSSDKQTSPLSHLENLEVLDMNGVPLIELTQQDGNNKSNLHYLDLSGSKFPTLPSEFFCEMLNLEELIFGNCTNLRELPSSISQLLNLLVLHVEGTQITSFPEDMFKAMQSLHTLKLINNMLLISLPRSLSKAKCLRELHIFNCAGLILESLWALVPCLEHLHIQTWKSLENIKIHGHPTLGTLSLSGPWIRCLSLCGCSKLKIVNFSDDLTALEDVDLSGTDLREVPHSLPNLPKLRMLLLLGVPYSMRFPWHQLVRFPKIFYLEHCSDDVDNQVFETFCQKKLCADGNHQKGERNTNTAKININDPRMFHSFNEDAAKKLVKEGQFLQSFDVQVKPCSVIGKKQQNNEAELSAMIEKNSTYIDVQYSEVTCIMPMLKLQPKQRHVEISAVNQYPNGLRNILSVTNTIFITDDNFIKCLTDLNYNLMTLDECQLLHCNQMIVVLRMKSMVTEVLESLRILQVSFLKNLLFIVDQVKPGYESTYELITLKLLKHIHLEHCPRLEKMFPCSLSLPTLESLVILFCSNLKTIFYKQHQYQVAPSPLPNIKRIYLQELPQLLHIHDDVMFRFESPNWEKLFVRGCPSFQRLPLLKKEYPRSKVEVNGEREWWNTLQLKVPEQSDYYMHVVPPEFVSRKKHIIESYLR